MKFFDIQSQVLKLQTNPVILSMLNGVEFYRGRSFNLPKKVKLNRLHDLSKRRSVTSSNKIEGIQISKKQEEALFVEGLAPETQEEKMLIGYNNALEHIFNVYKYQELDDRFIKYLHELEWKTFNPLYGGTYKDHQNYIREYLPNGTSRTIFIPTKPEETEQTLGNLIWQFNNALSNSSINRLVLIFVFILDFLCVHPFNDGNGRVSRLLTTYLLLKYGYDLDRYYSTSYLILRTLEDYYTALEKSSAGWNEDNNDYSFFVIYMLSVMVDGYKKLDYMFSLYQDKSTLIEKVHRIINETNEPISKGDLEEILFSNKRDSIEEALGKLIKSNEIKLIQKGKYSLYWKI